ncbi:AAWKG family protein, partial [Streptomyces sp. SID3212]|uniref:AAWKG family protein n=1 Tax=Streptomyces sp. SID3212 TaxID=2690259 RepID=UPI0013CB6C78
MAESEASPKDNNDDDWAMAVKKLTGYEVGPRAMLFEKMKGNDEIPLMHVRLDHAGSYYESGFAGSGGWHTKNTDYTIPFYRSYHDADKTSPGTKLDRYRAYITILATVGDAPPSGMDVIGSFEYTSKVLKDEGGWNKDGKAVSWDTTKLAQYIHGTRAALMEIATSPYSSHGFSHSGIDVTDSLYVDLGSFSDTARAFDRVVTFFKNSAAAVGKWDNEDIGEGSKSWDGTSAAIFKALIHKLARNYEGYADQIAGEEGAESTTYVTIEGDPVFSEPARALADAQWTLYQQAMNLVAAWDAWRPESSPQQHLYDLLQEARMDILDNQFGKIDFQPSTNRYDYSSNIVAGEGFSGVITIDGQPYGAPTEMTTWKKIGEEAVRRWEQSVKNWLGPAGSEAILAIDNAFTAAEKAFDPTITDKDKKSLSDIAAKEESKAEKAAAEKEKEEAKKEAEKEKEEAKKEAEKEKEEAKKERDAEKAEAEKEKEEAKAEAEKEKEEAKKERDAEKAEAEKEKEEAKAEAAKEKEEAKAEHAAEKAEAEKEKEEAKAEA